MDRVQVQAARLPSPDNPFKAETNDAATSPQGQALKVYMSDFYVSLLLLLLLLFLFIIPSRRLGASLRSGTVDLL
jgi:hypothetical protein